MTQIKGTFEGCGEAPAPLKINEVFISHADSTLNTARSRAVTVNVSLRSLRCLFSLADGPGRTKRTHFFMLFFHAFLTPDLPSFSFPSSYFPPIGHHRALLPVFSGGTKQPFFFFFCGFFSDPESHTARLMLWEV